MAPTKAYLLVDANVLIDYVASDPSILTLASHHLGQVYVLSTVLDEVDGFDEAECERLGLKVLEPELAQLTTAAAKRGSLSTEDHLCLVVALANGWTCVTNDSALRRLCSDEGVRRRAGPWFRHCSSARSTAEASGAWRWNSAYGSTDRSPLPRRWCLGRCFDIVTCGEPFVRRFAHGPGR